MLEGIISPTNVANLINIIKSFYLELYKLSSEKMTPKAWGPRSHLELKLRSIYLGFYGGLQYF